MSNPFGIPAPASQDAISLVQPCPEDAALLAVMDEALEAQQDVDDAIEGEIPEGGPALSGWSRPLLPTQFDLHDDLDPNGQNHHNQKQEPMMGCFHHSFPSKTGRLIPAGLRFLARSFQRNHIATGLASRPSPVALSAPEPRKLHRVTARPETAFSMLMVRGRDVYVQGMRANVCPKTLRPFSGGFRTPDRQRCLESSMAFRNSFEWSA